MREALLILVSITHFAAALGFWRAIRTSRYPNLIDFACASVLLCYDTGIWLEVFGLGGESKFVGSLLSTSDVDFGIALGLLLLAPWTLRIGARLANNGQELVYLERGTQAFSRKRRAVFYWMATGITVPLAVLGCVRLSEGLPIWEARTRVGAEWGALIIVLYLPLHLLAYYVCQEDSRSKRGMLFSAWLVIAAALSTLAVGERTNLLVPIVIIGFFAIRPTARTMLVGAAGIVLLAAVVLPVFKLQYRPDTPKADLLLSTVQNDFSRTGSLATAVELSKPVGVAILPYPMAGYVYSALFFVPRGIVPFKGQPTAAWFTGYVAGSNPDETDWGLGLGCIEELLLNAGIILTIPGLVVYGLAVGWIDRISRRSYPLLIPTRLGCLWLCGYHLPAVLLLFAAMAAVVYALDLAFTARSPMDVMTDVESDDSVMFSSI